MPTISMFYGILVMMFFRDNSRHHLPHIHVRYQGSEAAISLEKALYRQNSLKWCRFGLIFTKKIYYSIGN